MIRAFVGVRIDPDTVEKIWQVVSQLRQRLTGIRWVAPANFHFTLKFLGDVEDEKIESVARALEGRLGLFPRFAINAKGLGVFPDLRRARVLWVGMEGKELGNLTAQVERTLEPLGFAREKRAFRPHLTVGRWRNLNGSPAQLAKEIERWQGHEFGETRVEEVILFQSVLNPQGAVYRPLKVMALGDQPHLN